MAKTLFGALIVDMRNKLGGHVLSKNRGGSFIRRKVSPAQPRTSYQRVVRALVTQFSRAWSGVLGDAERSAWTAFAAGHPTTDQFGQTVQLTGEQMYVRLNTVIVFHGGTAIDDPPPDLSVAAITDFTPSATETGPTFLLDTVLPATILADERYVVWATAGMSVGRNSLDSFYRYVGTFATLTTGDLDIETAYLAKFG